jgi:hypothetical protein
MTQQQNIKIEDGHIIIQSLDVMDDELAIYLHDFREEELAEVIRRAIKIGLIALKGSVTTEKVDYIEKEFNKLAVKLSVDLDKFKKNFSDAFEKVFNEDGGIMKTTLERYLGEGGKLEDLFDPQHKGSAISKISTILDEHFKGKDSVIFKLLDHTAPESPISSLKKELIENYLQVMRDKLIGKEAAEEERAKGTAKGRTYQENLFLKINEICKPFQDVPQYTADIIGKIAKSKVGDVVVTINPSSTGDIPLRIVFEAKDRGDYNIQKIQKELDEAKENRDAYVGIAVFSEDTCPLECNPFQQYGDDEIVCTYNQDDPECLGLNLAYRVSRIVALKKLGGTKPLIDKAQMQTLINQCKDKLKAITSIKSKITKLANDVTGDLDDLSTDLAILFNKLDETIL